MVAASPLSKRKNPTMTAIYAQSFEGLVFIVISFRMFLLLPKLPTATRLVLALRDHQSGMRRAHDRELLEIGSAGYMHDSVLGFAWKRVLRCASDGTLGPLLFWRQ